jgi:hypothetical protein
MRSVNYRHTTGDDMDYLTSTSCATIDLSAQPCYSSYESISMSIENNKMPFVTEDLKAGLSWNEDDESIITVVRGFLEVINKDLQDYGESDRSTCGVFSKSFSSRYPNVSHILLADEKQCEVDQTLELSVLRTTHEKTCLRLSQHQFSTSLAQGSSTTLIDGKKSYFGCKICRLDKKVSPSCPFNTCVNDFV